MICAFCGTDNREENKFCGMCGVRLENRNGERRIAQGSVSLTCPACRQVNEPGHKFCGLCGTRMDRRGNDRRTAMPEERAAAIANVQLPPPDMPASAQQESRSAGQAAHVNDQPAPLRTSTGIFREASTRTTTIGGPSFLGLSDDSGGQGDYLLEDEGSSGGVLRKLVLLAILAAIGGLVFVQWRSNSGFFANPKLPEPPKIASPQLPLPQPDHQEAGKVTPQDSSPPDSAKQSASDAPDTKSDTTVAKDEDYAESRSHAKKKTTEETSSDHSPSPALLRAQAFLLGKNGVKQNCDQGLVYLRAATKANEPAAAMQMGALYASGHCVTRDRVMAYRWFNSAHELEPDDPEIKSDMEQLWGQMTPQERRQAGR
jgi:hypothetical protein